MVEGTPLLREHLGKTWIEGSNPSVSAKHLASMRLSGAFFIRHTIKHTKRWRGCSVCAGSFGRTMRWFSFGDMSTLGQLLGDCSGGSAAPFQIPASRPPPPGHPP